MSSDPESRQGLPESQPTTDEIPRTPPREKVDYKDEECCTPTGPEHRIPPVLVCPPAPRRKRQRTAAPDCGARKSRDFSELIDDLSWEDAFERMFPQRNIESENKNSNLKRRFPCS
ncbi:cyclin-dependent protein kinase inhibitor SMR2-like [Actinidia eriantha]|uniref:cyclin-dependent protein kinase inhibitor SMR2-like n=1 Tax=Actinidia eriantha TaxID=165200 RepID=UPI00258E499A|nr:cyclin-dependent protein kinase inhibitor SMR2-like [Actinidia eriantha]